MTLESELTPSDDHNVPMDRPVVLVAEDDEDILDLVSYRLEKLGHEVLVARDGREALRIAIDRHPDLAVLDVMMPEVDGFEVTRQIRLNAATERLPVILLTAKVHQVDVEQAFAAGADEYVRKPFSADDLLLRVEALLARS